MDVQGSRSERGRNCTNLSQVLKAMKGSRKGSHKVDRLLAQLTPIDQATFDLFCRYSPTYSSIQKWFQERGLKVSINAIFHWWHANFPTSAEIKFGQAIGIQDMKSHPNQKALDLARIATSIIYANADGKSTNCNCHDSVALIKNIIALAKEVRMLSALSANVVAVDQALLRSMQVETQNLNSNTSPVISEEISQHLKQQNTNQRQCQVLNLVSTNIDSY